MPVPKTSDAEAAFEERSRLVREAFDAYHTSILYFVIGLTRNREDARDILQKLWKWSFEHLPNNKLKYEGLLYTKARNLTKDYFRDNKRKPLDNAEVLEEWHMPKIEQNAYTSEEEARMKSAFFERFDGILTDKQAEIFWLHARYGFVYQEISEMTGLSVSTIGTHVNTARSKLAAHIEKEGYHD